MSAVISSCGRYRYALSRQTGLLNAGGTVLFIMLNPSTADAETDDPTIRRCLGFARRWGYRRLDVANLYAWRATDPARLHDAADPVGPENDQWIARLACRARLVIVAWGANLHPQPRRVGRVCDLLDHYRRPVRCLGLTQHGHPRHPVRLAGAIEPVPFPTGRTAA